MLNIQELVLPYLGESEKQQTGRKATIIFMYPGIKPGRDCIALFRRISTNHLKLTPSEIKISNLVKQGKTSKEIASLMSLSDKTIEIPQTQYP